MIKLFYLPEPSDYSADPFTEPTEFEYLRKVIFEYMMGRETKVHFSWQKSRKIMTAWCWWNAPVKFWICVLFTMSTLVITATSHIFETYKMFILACNKYKAEQKPFCVLVEGP